MYGLIFCLYNRKICHYVVQLADDEYAEIGYIKFGSILFQTSIYVILQLINIAINSVTIHQYVKLINEILSF